MRTKCATFHLQLRSSAFPRRTSPFSPLKTYFLYDGGSVTMESDGSKVTAKNTYGGLLLLRTVFGDTETTYEYLYNAHGDVVTLLSDGAVEATYYYDSFGNILDQTGEVDNSILYAGYQYDEETGLYYINARMYDPVTARFLQADTYLGNLNDPLSLNLYTYCLNNPHKYTDPSGHFAITLGGILLAARIVTSLVSGVMSGISEYKRQVAEGDNYADWKSILFVGGANAGLSFATFGIGQGAVAGAGVAAVFKHLGKAIVRDAAIGALADAGIETARQLITGTKITNLEYDRITEAGIVGGIVGGGSTIVGAALEGLARTRVVKSAVAKFNKAISKGADSIKSGFAKTASKNGKTATEAVESKVTAFYVTPEGVAIPRADYHSLSDVDARKWYLAQEATIPDLIDYSQSLEKQAYQAFSLRNKFRTAARELMANRELAESLYITDPNPTWEALIKKQRAKGLTGDDIYKAIIQSSQRSRVSVNKSLGLE